jgi:hypothetical protein
VLDEALPRYVFDLEARFVVVLDMSIMAIIWLRHIAYDANMLPVIASTIIRLIIACIPSALTTNMCNSYRIGGMFASAKAA